MNTEIVLQLSPEEEELAKKRDELAILQVELADRELYLADLRAELAAFDGRYLREVGVLYAKLDEWNARLAELRAKKAGTPEALAEATEARAQAKEAYSAAHGEAAEVQPFVPSADLRKLYREAAKRVHPDTATDDADRVRRERRMKEVNAAYVSGDEDALRRVLSDLNASPDAVQGAGIGADLIRVLRQLRQLRNRLTAIEHEIANLSESDVATLKAKANLAASQGKDLFAQMATSVQERIMAIQQQVEGRFAGAARA
jgi:hypothetical protein